MVFGKLENIAFIEASVHGIGVFCTHAINYICFAKRRYKKWQGFVPTRISPIYISCSPRAKLDLRKIVVSPKCVYKIFINICKCVKIRILALKIFGRKCLEKIKIMFEIQ